MRSKTIFVLLALLVLMPAVLASHDPRHTPANTVEFVDNKVVKVKKSH